MQGKTEHDGEQQYLQNVAAGKSANHAVRNDIQQERHHALLLSLLGIHRHRFGIQRGRVDIHADARLQHVDHHQANNQGDGTDHFKIEQRDGTGTADRFHAFHTGDAGDHGTENNRCDDHLDQLNESIAERLHLGAQLGVEMP